MLQCPRHIVQGLGGAVLAAAQKCETCTLDTYSAYKLCAACSLALDECLECRAPTHSGRGLLTRLMVAIERWRLTRALSKNKADYRQAIASFAAEARTYEEETSAARRRYQLACAELEEQLLVANQKMEIATEPLVAQKEMFAILAKLQAARAVAQPVYDSAMKATAEAFALHKQTYDDAKRIHHLADCFAKEEFNARIKRLGAKFVAKLRYEAEMRHFDS